MSTISAIYDHGVFKPVLPVDLPDGTHVEVVLPADGEDPVAILQLRFPGSFGTMSKEDADELQRIVDEEFGQVNPDDWR